MAAMATESTTATPDQILLLARQVFRLLAQGLSRRTVVRRSSWTSDSPDQKVSSPAYNNPSVYGLRVVRHPWRCHVLAGIRDALRFHKYMLRRNPNDR